MTNIKNGYGRSTVPSEAFKQTTTISGFGTPNEIVILFDKIFSSSLKMRELNRMILDFIDESITSGNIDIIKRLISDEAIMDFHPSLLKSILVMTEGLNHLADVNSSRKRIESKMTELLAGY